MISNAGPLYFVFCITLKTKQFSLGCVSKQRGDGMKRFGDMKGNYEPINNVYIQHVRLRAGRKRHATAD